MIEWFKQRFNTWQKRLQLVGWIVGFTVGSMALALGLAYFSIPLIALVLGIPVYLFLTGQSFASAFKYFGMVIDAIISEKKMNNEQIGATICFILGLIITLIALVSPIPIPLGVIANNIPMGAIIPIATVLISGRLTSAGSYFGKTIDNATNEKTIVDLLHTEKPKFPPNTHHYLGNKLKTHRCPTCEQATVIEVNRVTLKTKISSSITDYMQNRDQHLGFFAKYFDYDRGEIRADKYMSLLKQAKSTLETYLILYALLASHSGKNLKKYVQDALGYSKHSRHYVLTELKNSIGRELSTTPMRQNDRRDELNLLIEKIVIDTNNGRREMDKSLYVALSTMRANLTPSKLSSDDSLETSSSAEKLPNDFTRKERRRSLSGSSLLKTDSADVIVKPIRRGRSYSSTN